MKRFGLTIRPEGYIISGETRAFSTGGERPFIYIRKDANGNRMKGGFI